ncbi:hypothetical protein HU200_005230 [Digitaria exilis]|uniref:Uncharacterized protein n=1 Tax=Digitaria exilis TaxID=1010633 RepID=A0A835FQX7_9POAL|nr:hypothetical protein HU200_005230 [Digitaria exilis]
MCISVACDYFGHGFAELLLLCGSISEKELPPDNGGMQV